MVFKKEITGNELQTIIEKCSELEILADEAHDLWDDKDEYDDCYYHIYREAKCRLEGFQECLKIITGVE